MTASWTDDEPIDYFLTDAGETAACGRRR